MTFDQIVRAALEQRATDIHLEPNLPVMFRINGSLKRTQTVLSHDALRSIASRLLPLDDWQEFEKRGSYDLTKIVSGVQCRVNVLRSDRGIGLAVRLLLTATNTIKSCNLHTQLTEFLQKESGLILLTGPTGSGKSTTLSALLEEINSKSSKHIITLESPIEYRVHPKKSIIRQREVGQHTPSYEQGLMDCLREDPDVIVVGEMRDSESMRWTLNAAETGHLVIATMHSTNCADAVYRMMMSFPPERQATVLAQLGDCLVAIISQRMTYRDQPGILVPCLEIMVGTHATRNAIRKGEVTKLISLLQAGGQEGNWTFDRYQSWLDSKTDWVLADLPPPILQDSSQDIDLSGSTGVFEESLPSLVLPPRPTGPRRTPPPPPPGVLLANEDETVIDEYGMGGIKKNPKQAAASSKMKINKDGRIEIPEAEADLEDLLQTIQGTNPNLTQLKGTGKNSKS
jgi:twitching motility protein PilT